MRLFQRSQHNLTAGAEEDAEGFDDRTVGIKYGPVRLGEMSGAKLHVFLFHQDLIAGIRFAVVDSCLPP